jgi:Asp-tRNA(Asn)/Glu-tRNA(Gln) amidotransferase B subunit
MKLKTIEFIDRIENGIIYGYNIDQTEDSIGTDNTIYVGQKRFFMKLEKSLWFIEFNSRWSSLELEHITLSKRKEFEVLTDHYPLNAFYYLDAAVHTDKSKLGELGMNWLLGPITEIMNERNMSKFNELLPAHKLNEFLVAMFDELFNKSKAKEAFRDFLVDFDLEKIISDPKYKVLDQNIVDAAIAKVIADNPEMVAKAKLDPKLVNWIVGQTMKACQGQAKAPDVKAKIDIILAS